MKELLEIIRTHRREQAPMALATIVQTAGSTYRHAGARMLIVSDSETVGCIDGNGLDHDVVLHGLEVIKNKKPVLITYDTSPAHDLVLGAGTGCNGLMEIFVEYLSPDGDTRLDLLDFMDRLIQTGGSGAVATVVKTRGEINLQVGDRIMVDDLDRHISNVTDERAVETLAALARSAVTARKPERFCHKTETGSAEIFVEPCLPQPHLLVLGAGPDAVPLVRLAHELGYKISVVDPRPAHATAERFPLADEVLIAHPEDNDMPWCTFDVRKLALIMTHNYELDQGWLGRLLPLGLTYVGLMGPRKRAEKMLEELVQNGVEIKEQDLLPLHAPMGLDIGAENPEQIALSILAEIQATLGGREAGKMSWNKGPIRLSSTDSKIILFPAFA